MNVQIPYETVKMLLEVLDKVDWESDYINSCHPAYLEYEYDKLYKVHNLFSFEHYKSIEMDEAKYCAIVKMYKELKVRQW